MTVEDEPSEASRPNGAAWRAGWFDWRQHSSLLVAGALAGLTSIRLIRVSRSSAETAYALLTISGTANALTSVLLQALPIVIGGVSAGFVAAAIPRRRRIPPLALAGVVVACFVTPLAYLLVLVPVVAFDVIEQRRSTAQQRNPKHLSDRVPISPGFVVGFLLIATVVVTDDVWLPAERLAIRGSEPLVGYVLATDEASLTVLKESNREVVRIAKSEIADRYFCSLEANVWSWFRESPFALIKLNSDTPIYPSCGEL